MEKLSSKKRTRTPHSPHKGRGTVPPKERGGANEKQKDRGQAYRFAHLCLWLIAIYSKLSVLQRVLLSLLRLLVANKVYPIPPRFFPSQWFLPQISIVEEIPRYSRKFTPYRTTDISKDRIFPLRLRTNIAHLQ